MWLVMITMTLTILSLRFPGCVLNADGEWWRGEERPPRAAARLLRTPVLRQTCRNQETHKVFRVSESNATGGVSSEDPISLKTRMHSSRMRTGRSLTVCWSLLPGGVCLVGGVVSAPGGVCLVRGWWCLLPGGSAWSGGGWCLLPGGGGSP